MIKYAVKTERIEFNPAKHRNAEAAFIDLDDHSDETIGLFDTVEEARSAPALIDVNPPSRTIPEGGTRVPLWFLKTQQ